MSGYLDYPLDVQNILRKKSGIRRELIDGARPVERLPVKIALLGGSTIGHLRDVFELFLLKENLEPAFYESQYGRYYEESAYPHAALSNFGPDIAYIHTSIKNVVHFPAASDDVADAEEKLEAEVARLRRMWTELRSRHNCLIIQNNFELPEYRFLGNLDASDLRGRVSFVTHLNQRIAEFARDNESYFFVNDINYLSACVGLETWFNKSLWHHSKYALSLDAIPVLAKNLASIVRSIYGKDKRCLVLDLDNTLWKGVVGDDGLDGVRMSEGDAVGEAHRDFQRYIKELKSRGIILAVCSKNEYDTAKRAFQHPDAILKFDDFAAFKANWNAKHENIVAIAQELNIGLDSIVFVDDNPVERDIVRKHLPEVAVPELGDDGSRYVEIIDRSGYFAPAALSDEDLRRNSFYSSNGQRRILESSFTDLQDYLKSLEMRAEIAPFAPVFMDRITQLVNKTNQFNLTTRRCTRPEVERWGESEQFLTLFGRLDDKFGSNGLITTLVGEVKDHKLDIMVWVMSCRVFGRNMEFALFDSLVKECRERAVTEVLGHYRPTKRNGLVGDLYERLGFELLDEQEDGTTSWRYLIREDYRPLNEIIDVHQTTREC